MSKRALVVLCLAAACGNKSSKLDQPLVQKADKDTPDGIELRLSNGKQGAPSVDHTKVAQATKLSDADVQALLARAKPLAAEAGDQQAFALRPASQPPPRTGTTVQTAFPPPPSSSRPPAVATGALEVVRYMPEGDVEIAPELSVTFNQPMIAVTSQEDAAATTPVKLSPQPKGKWRWLGTRTILFDPDPRFPQATTYSVQIPAGTKSATGAVLGKEVKFTFQTPPPKLIAHYPDDSTPQRLDAAVFLLFDQKVDPAAVLEHLKMTSAKAWDEKPIAVRLVDASELKKDAKLSALAASAKRDEQDGRWLVLRAADKLPADASINIAIAAGTPSAEGRNPTKTLQSFSFHTYPPLRLERAECGYNNDCRPGMPFQLEFDNPLDADRFDEKQVSISPDLPGASIEQRGNYIMVNGLAKARTTYKVTVAGALADEFGQTLGHTETRTFAVGDASPTFFGPQGMVVLDPAATKPTLDFFSTGYKQLKVTMYSVDPSNYDAWLTYLQNRWNHDKPVPPPGKQVQATQIAVAGSPNELSETHVDLGPALHGGHGHAIAIVEPSPWTEKYEPPRMAAWVQATKLAIDAHVDGDSLVAFASELETGKPAANVDVEIRPYGIRGKTDDRGLATLQLAPAQQNAAHYVLARRGDDVAFVAGGNNWFKQPRPGQLAWYVIDDRKMYKPGEEVSLKGWLRVIDPGKGGDVGLATAGGSVMYKVVDSRNVQLATGTATVSELGGFDTKFTLPKTPNLGYARVEMSATGTLASFGSQAYVHSFQIEEFRRPEFAVSAQAGAGPFVIGESGDVTVSAKYYAGGPLPGADVNWSVSASQTSFTPPNRDDYVFGRWQPWWGRLDYEEDDMPVRRRRDQDWTLKGTTDASGEHVLHVEFVSVKPTVPMSVVANASVADVNRQAWFASATMLVHPSKLYVGMKAKRPFVPQGTPLDVDVIGVDLDGKAAPGAKIDVRAVRLDWKYKHGRYQRDELDPQTCAVTAAAAPQPCHFASKQGGTYEVTATITDDKGRANQTTLELWVEGGQQPVARGVARGRVQLIPDKKEYAPGDTAELLVQSPFSPAEGIVTWRRSGIVKLEKISLSGPTTTIKVPLEDAMTPGLEVQVDLVGQDVRTDDKGQPDPKLPKRPAYAVGTLYLAVPPKQRTLSVAVTPAAPKLAPGESTKLTVEVKDAQGRPVANAEAAVLVVDESVLALSGYQFPTPIDTFYAARGAGVADYYLRSYVHLARPDATAPGSTVTIDGKDVRYRAVNLPRGGDGNERLDDAEMAAPMEAEKKEAFAENGTMGKLAPAKPGYMKLAEGRMGKGGGKNAPDTTPIAIRSNFNPLAAFSPQVKTGADGRAIVDVKVPDNLTRYRVVAIAVAGERQFGKGESSLVARLPLMVRPSPPRFLNFGDTFRLPIVVQNQTDAPMTVRLAARTTNLALVDGAGREVTVPANDRVEVQLPAAAQLAGTARLQVVSSANGAADASELSFPVWTPATTEAFATYGTIDDGATKQPVALPGQVVTQFGGLDVTTSSTNLASLTDAVIYLVHYPFECAEQRSSRILAIATLKDVLSAFHAKDLPSVADMQHSVDVDIEHLSQMQNGDGGFAFWDRGHPSEPYLTVFVANALARAKAKGFAVPQSMLDHARDYLRDIESHYPDYYGPDVRHAISAYALYTRKQLGDVDIAKGKKLFVEAGAPDKLSMEADGWLLSLFAGNAAADTERKAIVRYALNHVSETAGAANFTTGYGDGNYLLLASDRRVDGVMLEALIQAQPDSDLIDKVVRGLLAHRTAGHWLNTQENAFVLQALDLYFHTYEKTTPNFVARVWLGNDYAGDHAFRGRTTDQARIAIAMKDVAAHDKSDLVIQKDGAGRLYYRIGMTYAPASLKLEPADYGFVVERRYEAVDDPKDVTRDAQGVWHVKAGARVRVRLKMMNENRRYHVALVDPLPAGLEPMNPALAVTGPVPQDPKEQQARGKYWWFSSTWYEHQNMRDERVEAFAALLWEGVHDYTYVARATTPGTFVVPPPKAEEMYMPETFGRGGSDRVTVE
jgi:uncharacterized protein YfaS (alpha-2-macroglobulin family)